jgi:hypothetical protein
MVIEAGGSGVCILGARVEVMVAGTHVQGATITNPCDVWDVGGLFFNDLPRGVEVTLRASAAGYLPREIVMTPAPSPGVLRATIIELPQAQ